MKSYNELKEIIERVCSEATLNIVNVDSWIRQKQYELSNLTEEEIKWETWKYAKTIAENGLKNNFYMLNMTKDKYYECVAQSYFDKLVKLLND